MTFCDSYFQACIHGATWYAILADETADIANHEQLSVSIRWVGDAYEINEDFIGLVQVPRTTADTLAAAIKDDGSPPWGCYTDTGRRNHCYQCSLPCTQPKPLLARCC